MPATTENKHADYHRIRKSSHPDCVVCDSGNECGLGLKFHITDKGVVEASFPCDVDFQGYAAVLHGGIICTLLDGAMTNCLFAFGYASLTVELKVRFRHPVATGRPATVRAWIASSLRPIHDMEAELIQEGQVMATSKAKFMEKVAAGWFGKG
jgi:acyl-coenzyme A thioesterase PaaI-like protein